MASTLSTKSVLQFFLKGGATQSLFRWLDFRLFVARKNLTLAAADNAQSSTASSTSSSTASSTTSPESAPAHYLNLWEQQLTISSPATWFLRLAAAVVALIGFSAMAGVLNYSGQQPINIWVPLALFAFVPLLFTLSSFYFSVLSPAKQHLQGHPFLIMLVNKLKLEPFLPYKNLLLPWLFWQVQTLAIVFSVSALLSFFLLATFQDYRFGWSSTLITDNATMTQLMAIISWPWQWLMASPSAELISHSRFSVPGAVPDFTKSAVNNTWWITLVMAMLVYGLLPRLLLALLLRQRFMRKLRSNILNSSDVEQFIIAQQHQESRNPIQSDDELAQLAPVDLNQPNIDLITWQQPNVNVAVVKNLGSADWVDDEQWLQSAASVRANPVRVIVDPLQTPTGELADCIDLLKQKNATVELVLYGKGDADSRYLNQQKSWQFFADRNHIALKVGN